MCVQGMYVHGLFESTMFCMIGTIIHIVFCQLLLYNGNIIYDWWVELWNFLYHIVPNQNIMK